ncbi:MAG: hypothetical protein QW215_05990, partial [Ignisphaera sp.]
PYLKKVDVYAPPVQHTPPSPLHSLPKKSTISIHSPPDTSIANRPPSRCSYELLHIKVSWTGTDEAT